MAAKIVNLSLMKKAVDLAKTFLHLDHLSEFQEQALTAILEERDVFIAQPTGSGKSAVYQLAPFAYDLHECLKTRSTSLMTAADDILLKSTEFTTQALVIQPLISLMEDQMNILKRLSESSTRKITVGRLYHEREVATGSKSATSKTIKNNAEDVCKSHPTIIFTSPEAVVITHRSLLRSSKLNIKLVAVDEAHCVVKW